jgi:exodeoxyribonuclease III
MLTIATWNVNSVRARLDRFLAWLERRAPDVVCLQEIKCEDDAFPHEAVAALGYRTAVFGQKTYNGVAILSRYDLADVERGLEDHTDGQSRVLAATTAGVRVYSLYVPNGKVVGSEAWDYKLDWYERLRAHVAARYAPTDPLVLCGDFNVAIDERDVYDADAWKGTVLYHPKIRQALAAVTDWGLVDTIRQHHTGQGPYSWWDYRALGFPRNEGLRIDHIFATAPLAERCVDAFVDREERKGAKPSDHAPVITAFDLAT